MDKKLLGVFSCLFFGSLSVLVAAQELSPERFVQADIEARQVTLAGLEMRLRLLHQGANPEAQQQLEEDNRRNVDTVFARYNTTGPAHAAYGTQYSDTIAIWLEDHPAWQQQYDELTDRLDALTQQFNTLVGGN